MTTDTPTITAIVTLMAALGTLVTTLVAAYITFRNGVKGDERGRKVEEIHNQINGNLEKTNALIAKASFAEGVKSETDKH